jgi:hypothetical protein
MSCVRSNLLAVGALVVKSVPKLAFVPTFRAWPHLERYALPESVTIETFNTTFSTNSSAGQTIISFVHVFFVFGGDRAFYTIFMGKKKPIKDAASILTPTVVVTFVYL